MDNIFIFYLRHLLSNIFGRGATESLFDIYSNSIPMLNPRHEVPSIEEREVVSSMLGTSCLPEACVRV